MSTMRIPGWMAWTVLLLALSPRVALSGCDWSGVLITPDVVRRLDAFRREGCLIAPACDFVLDREIASLDRMAAPERYAQVLGDIEDSLKAGLPAGYPGLDAMVARLERWKTLVRGPDPSHLPVAEWDVTSGGLFANEPDQVRFATTVGGRMRDLHTGAPAELALAATQMRMALLVQQALLARMASTREAFLAELGRCDRRWQSYFADTRASYPWELLLTDAFLRGPSPVNGFQAPKTSQVLALHPDAAYQYAAFGADRLSESLVLELLGLYRWSWGSDDRVKPRLSGSAFVGWQGTTKTHPYWGLMAHLAKGGSIGVGVRPAAQQKTEWAVFATGDAGKLFLKRSDARSEKVSEYLGSLLQPAP